MYVRAARAAEDMQAPSCTPNSTNAAASSSSEEEQACQMDCTGGVWGRCPADTSSVPSVSDEDLQAQAWFPGILTSMLHCAETAANVVLNESGMIASPCCETGPEAVWLVSCCILLRLRQMLF